MSIYSYVGTNRYPCSITLGCVTCEVCVCVCVCSCLIWIRTCVMSDLWGDNDYAVTAAVNPLGRLGGMNTCDQHRATEHVRKPHNTHRYAQTLQQLCSVVNTVFTFWRVKGHYNGWHFDSVKSTDANSNINDGSITFSFFSFRVLVVGMLAHCHTVMTGKLE